MRHVNIIMLCLQHLLFASLQLKSRNLRNYSVAKISDHNKVAINGFCHICSIQFVRAIAIVIPCFSSQLESAHNAIHCFSVY